MVVVTQIAWTSRIEEQQQKIAQHDAEISEATALSIRLAAEEQATELLLKEALAEDQALAESLVCATSEHGKLHAVLRFSKKIPVTCGGTLLQALMTKSSLVSHR